MMPCTTLTFDGITYTELRGSGEFETNQVGDGQRTTRTYLCDWDDAYNLARSLVGKYIDSGGGLQTYQLPQRDPNRPHLFADTVKVEGLVVDGQDGTGAIRYKKARLEVEFNMRLNDQTGAGGPGNTITFLTESKQAAVQALTIPEDLLVWKTGRVGEVIGDDAVNFVRLPATKLSITISFWFGAPTDTTFEDLAGTVNDKDITILRTKYKKGKLRYDFGNRTRQFTSDGVEAWQVQLDFMYNRNGWNKKYDPKRGQFEEYQTAAGTDVHEEEDFKKLFPVGLVTTI